MQRVWSNYADDLRSLLDLKSAKSLREHLFSPNILFYHLWSTYSDISQSSWAKKGNCWPPQTQNCPFKIDFEHDYWLTNISYINGLFVAWQSTQGLSQRKSSVIRTDTKHRRDIHTKANTDIISRKPIFPDMMFITRLPLRPIVQNRIKPKYWR